MASESFSCNICLEPYSLKENPPKVLPCGHDYCAKCLQNVYYSSKGKYVDCPSRCGRHHLNPETLGIARCLICDVPTSNLNKNKVLLSKIDKLQTTLDQLEIRQKNLSKIMNERGANWHLLIKRMEEERVQIQEMKQLLDDRSTQCKQLLKAYEKSPEKFAEGAHFVQMLDNLLNTNNDLNLSVVDFSMNDKLIELDGTTHQLIKHILIKNEVSRIADIDDYPKDFTVIDRGKVVISNKATELPLFVIAVDKHYLLVLNDQAEQFYKIVFDRGFRISNVLHIEESSSTVLSISEWNSQTVKFVDFNGKIQQTSNKLKSKPNAHCQLSDETLSVACGFTNEQSYIYILSLPTLNTLTIIKHSSLEVSTSLTVYGQYLYVTNNSSSIKNISVFNINSKFSFDGSLSFDVKLPTGICVVENYLFVASYSRITQVNISDEHRVVKTVGSHGTLNDHFQTPTTLCQVVSKTGERQIVVCDYGNKRIKFYDLN